MPRYARARDMDSWLEDTRIAERGFVHRWQSEVTSGNGEDAFIEHIGQLLHPEYDVPDIGYGHGELSLHLAARCRSVVGIEQDTRLSWAEPGRLPSYEEVEAQFVAIFRRHRGPRGLVLRHQRLMWQACFW